MSRRYEQKHLLHNWSNCRHRNRAQTPRSILRVSFAGQFVLPKESSLLTLTGTAAFRCALPDEAGGFLELEVDELDLRHR